MKRKACITIARSKRSKHMHWQAPDQGTFKCNPEFFVKTRGIATTGVGWEENLFALTITKCEQAR
jgi:hypothetical protein